ncbi:MAG: hypothetical protein KF861_23035 [Planctomycetaceae bacterium]|nr:hypothetical protein [Planctomycetaceae bacterium]
MGDLYLGIAIQLFLMGTMFVLARWLTRRASDRICDLLAAITVIGIAVYARWFWEHSFMARLLPFSNLIIVSNWFPLAAGFLAGLVWQRIRDTPEHIPLLPVFGKFRGLPRRIFATLVLFAAGTFTLIAPLRGEPPATGDEWDGDLCYQTSEATCSAAAAATLLQYYGIFASEGEMADLCLTRRGTNWKGLFRGLMLKAAEKSHRVNVFDRTVDELVARFTEPCILQCELKLDDENATAEFELKGWVRGQPHSLVLIDIQDDRFIIFDPSVQMEVWSRSELETLWHGQGLQIVPDSSTLAAP